MKSKKTQENQRRKPKQARALEKYNRVLDACSRLLATMPYSKITMTEFSLESDLAYATLYQYFGSKEDIIVAWMARTFDQINHLVTLEKQSQDALYNVGETTSTRQSAAKIEQQIEPLIKTSLRVMSDNHAVMHEIVSAMPEMLTSKLILVVEDRTVDLVEELFSEKIEASPVADTEYYLRMLIRMIVGFIMSSLFSETNRIDVERDGKELAFIVNNYLKARALI